MQHDNFLKRISIGLSTVELQNGNDRNMFRRSDLSARLRWDGASKFDIAGSVSGPGNCCVFRNLHLHIEALHQDRGERFWHRNDLHDWFRNKDKAPTKPKRVQEYPAVEGNAYTAFVEASWPAVVINHKFERLRNKERYCNDALWIQQFLRLQYPGHHYRKDQARTIVTGSLEKHYETRKERKARGSHKKVDRANYGAQS